MIILRSRDNYTSVNDTFWGAWSDNHIRSWLVDNGYLPSDTKAKRDELVQMANEKYLHTAFSICESELILMAYRWNDINARTASYLTWPDARLRAYLRECGMSENDLPTTRPGLLRTLFSLRSFAYIFISIIEETRIRWIQTQTRAETFLARIREVIISVIFKTKDAFSHLFALLSGGWAETKGKVGEGQEYLQKRASDSGDWAQEKAGHASGWAQQKVDNAREVVGEKVKVSGQKLKGEL